MEWETTLRNRDKQSAKQLVNELSVIRKQYGESFNRFAEVLEYPINNVWLNMNKSGKFFNDTVSSHFRRVLVELKILALTGRTTFDF